MKSTVGFYLFIDFGKSSWCLQCFLKNQKQQQTLQVWIQIVIKAFNLKCPPECTHVWSMVSSLP